MKLNRPNLFIWFCGFLAVCLLLLFSLRPLRSGLDALPPDEENAQSGLLPGESLRGENALAVTQSSSWAPAGGGAWSVAKTPRIDDVAAGDVYVREYLSDSTGKFGPLRIEEHWLKSDHSPDGDLLLARHRMAAGHVIVRIGANRSQKELENGIRRQGYVLLSKRVSPQSYLVAVEHVQPGSVPDMCRALADDPMIDVVEPDFAYTISETRPDDPDYNRLWAMETIRMPEVWESVQGTGGVVVAIFDTGMDLTHPDLAANLWINPDEQEGNNLDEDGNSYVDDICGWDFYDNDNDPSDAHDHGTHVAGTIAAVGNNGVGVAGVGWNLRLLPIKFFGRNSNWELEGFASDAISGMYYVIALADRGIPVRVTNHSWGGDSASSLLEDVLRLAGDYGIIHVAAAGNLRTGQPSEMRDNDRYPHYPSSYTLSNIVAVANTTSTDDLHSSSYYGATSVDLAAPGTYIYSSLPSGGYGEKTGTSMASPHVAGALGLLFDTFPDLSWPEARVRLLDSVVKRAALDNRCSTGGRLDVYRLFDAMDRVIIHDPMPNSDQADQAFRVDAMLKPGASFVEAGAVQLLWNTTGSTNLFVTNTMSDVGGNRFESMIPGQSVGTTISYYIRVLGSNEVLVTHPFDAPAGLHHFDVTYPESITVYGDPADYGDVMPAYGMSTAPWGNEIVAEAPAFTEPVAGYRWRCAGWEGWGSLPSSGMTNRFTFELRHKSYLVWRWREQVLLDQQSEPAGIIDTQHWFDIGMDAETILAPGIQTNNQQQVAFVGWMLNGQRYPNDTDPSGNPVVIPSINLPHSAVARYVPVDLDSDSDGLPDWWELFYFNHLDEDGLADSDGDGASSADEYADRSDPRDAFSLPQGPEILHEPLPTAIASKSPWRVEAIVTDRIDVAIVILHWQRNDGDWRETRMTLQDGIYVGSIPDPDVLGDVFSYRISALDTAGNASETECYSFSVRYPILSYSPDTATLTTGAGRQAVVLVTVTNSGNADLIWHTTNAYEETVLSLSSDWTHGGLSNQWHVSSRESYSPPYAWFCGDVNGGNYHDSMDASLYSPPVLLGVDATLRFMQWAEMEYDGRPGYEHHYWDGAVVELSRDGGLSYESIAPVGGYPFMITSNAASPFVANRPCLGGQTGGWEAVEFDLSAYAGETVQIRFRFGTDGYVTSRGWFLDDISLSWENPWLVSPAQGTVAGGASQVISLELVAESPGVHRTGWTAACNAAGLSRFGVAVSLLVSPGTSMQIDGENSSQFVLIWPSQTGRLYHLSSATGFAEWVGVPGYTNLPGEAGTMSYTGSIEALPKKFYRIIETEP